MGLEYWRNAFYAEHNSFFLKRLYSEKVIMDKLKVIPNDAKPLHLPFLVERVSGRFYFVNEADRNTINGDDFRALMIHGLVNGRLASLLNFQ